MRTATCVDCRTVFTWATRGPVRQRCDTCTALRKRETDTAKSKRWRDADPERQKAAARRHHERRKENPAFRQQKRDNELRRVYGMTRAELDGMIAAQDGKCAVCGGPPNGPGTRLHVDHCHDSKRVRGLLCAKCNTAVGLLNDSPERAEALAAYLRR